MKKPSKFFVAIATLLVLAPLVGCLPGMLLGPSLAQIRKDQAQVIDKHGEDTREIELKTAVTLGGVTIPASSRVGFKDDGYMQWIKPAAEMSMAGIQVPAGSTIQVDESDNNFTGVPTFYLKSVKLGAAATYGKVSLDAGDEVSFDEDHLPNWALLGSGSRTFKGKACQGGSEVWFNMVGEVTKVLTPRSGPRSRRARRAASVGAPFSSETLNTAASLSAFTSINRCESICTSHHQSWHGRPRPCSLRCGFHRRGRLCHETPTATTFATINSVSAHARHPRGWLGIQTSQVVVPARPEAAGPTDLARCHRPRARPSKGREGSAQPVPPSRSPFEARACLPCSIHAPWARAPQGERIGDQDTWGVWIPSRG